VREGRQLGSWGVLWPKDVGTRYTATDLRIDPGKCFVIIQVASNNSQAGSGEGPLLRP